MKSGKLMFKAALTLAITLVLGANAHAATSDASISGTYTFLLTDTKVTAVETNNPNVSCPNNSDVSCQPVLAQGTIAGTFVADGKGHITKLSFTDSDPEGATLKSKNGTGTGTYKVVAGNTAAFSFSVVESGKSQSVQLELVIGSFNSSGIATMLYLSSPASVGNDIDAGVATKQ